MPSLISHMAVAAILGASGTLFIYLGLVKANSVTQGVVLVLFGMAVGCLATALATPGMSPF